MHPHDYFEPGRAQWEFLLRYVSSPMLVRVLPYIAVLIAVIIMSIITVALLLARAFRREIGGDAAALISGLGATEPHVIFIFSVVLRSLPDFHTALDEWECWNAGFRLGRPSAFLLSVGVPLHLQLS